MDSPLRLLQRLRSEPRRRDAVDAVATALLGLVLIPLGMVQINDAPWRVPDWAQSQWWHAVPLLLGCCALLAKRRRPVPVAVVVFLLSLPDVYLGGSVGMYVVLIDALYCVALHVDRARLRPAVIVMGSPIVLVPVALFVATGEARWSALMFLQAFALLGTPVWWGLSVRQQTELAALERARAEDLRRLSQLHRDQAVREERNRMAQDLHDALSSHLSTIAIHSGACLSTPGPGAAGAGASLAEIRAASVRALEDLREMILLLQTDQDQISPPAHLGDLATLVDSARSTGLCVQVDGDLTGLPTLPSVVEHAAYRILQESLANAAKHAPGAAVVIAVRVSGFALRLKVVSRPTGEPAGDATGGAQVVAGSGMGLRTMRDRATTLGGTFEAGWHEDGRRDGTSAGTDGAGTDGAGTDGAGTGGTGMDGAGTDGRAWVVAAELPLEEVLVR